MNWGDPEARLALLESVCSKEYNRLHRENMDANTVGVVNGYPIRLVESRFGTLHMVQGTSTAFYTLEEARDFALSQKPGSP